MWCEYKFFFRRNPREKVKLPDASLYPKYLFTNELIRTPLIDKSRSKVRTLGRCEEGSPFILLMIYQPIDWTFVLFNLLFRSSSELSCSLSAFSSLAVASRTVPPFSFTLSVGVGLASEITPVDIPEVFCWRVRAVQCFCFASSIAFSEGFESLPLRHHVELVTTIIICISNFRLHKKITVDFLWTGNYIGNLGRVFFCACPFKALKRNGTLPKRIYFIKKKVLFCITKAIQAKHQQKKGGRSWTSVFGFLENHKKEIKGYFFFLFSTVGLWGLKKNSATGFFFF